MTSRHWLPSALASLLMCLAVAAAARGAALDSLVASERAFARMSAEQGVRDAFVHWLAEDGVIFRPLATSGRKIWEARSPIRAKLAWEPSFAEISAAGDLGCTTGPWEFTPADSVRPAAYGHFVSIWQKQQDGAWRVAVDIGIGHEPTSQGVGHVQLATGPVHAPRRTGGPVPDLRDLDLAWTADARARGTAAAFTRWAARDVRFYLDGSPPVLGAAAALEKMKSVAGVTIWDPDAQRIARSADLGCTYGILERRLAGGAAPDSSVYLHVWRRGADGRWKVALALENPLPKAGRP